MIFDAIRESHDLQRDLCRKLTASRGEVAAREVLFLQLKVELMAHAAAEERALYVPLLMMDAWVSTPRDMRCTSTTRSTSYSKSLPCATRSRRDGHGQDVLTRCVIT